MFSADSLLGMNFQIAAAGMDGLSARIQAGQSDLQAIQAGTPGFVAHTVDFESSLKSAMGTAASTSGANGVAAQGASDSLTGQGWLEHGFTTQVDHTVDSSNPTMAKNQIVNRMDQDSVEYKILSQQITNRFTQLRGVISEMGRS